MARRALIPPPLTASLWASLQRGYTCNCGLPAKGGWRTLVLLQYDACTQLMHRCNTDGTIHPNQWCSEGCFCSVCALQQTKPLNICTEVTLPRRNGAAPRVSSKSVRVMPSNRGSKGSQLCCRN